MSLFVTILDWIAAASALGTVALWFLAQRESSGPTRGYCQLSYRVALAAAIICCSTASLLWRASSPRPSVIGKIAWMQQYHSRNSHGTSFNLQTGSTQLSLTSSNSSGAFILGETLNVRYLSHTSEVIDMEVLDGPAEGFMNHESDGIGVAFLFLCFGIAIAVFAISTWRNLPDGEDPSEYENDDEASAPQDVDEASLLHLNDR